MAKSTPKSKPLKCSHAQLLALLKREERRRSQVAKTVGSLMLFKACEDVFDYAMKIRTGEVILFSQATILNKEWVQLILKPLEEQPVENRIAFPAPRGMDVRLSDIVWVMDAPSGS